MVAEGVLGGRDAEGKEAAADGGGGGAEESEAKNMMQQVKDAGVAGIISYMFWELAFWGVSIPVCIIGYQAATGHWPDFSDPEDTAKLGAEAFAFVNVARFAVPLRISLALGTTPWVRDNIVTRIGFLNNQDTGDGKTPMVGLKEPPQFYSPEALGDEQMVNIDLGSRNAKEIFLEGLANLQADPMGWFFGAPSPLYSNTKGKTTRSTEKVSGWKTDVSGMPMDYSMPNFPPPRWSPSSAESGTETAGTAKQTTTYPSPPLSPPSHSLSHTFLSCFSQPVKETLTLHIGQRPHHANTGAAVPPNLAGMVDYMKKREDALRVPPVDTTGSAPPPPPAPVAPPPAAAAATAAPDAAKAAEAAAKAAWVRTQ